MLFKEICQFVVALALVPGPALSVEFRCPVLASETPVIAQGGDQRAVEQCLSEINALQDPSSHVRRLAAIIGDASTAASLKNIDARSVSAQVLARMDMPWKFSPEADRSRLVQGIYKGIIAVNKKIDSLNRESDDRPQLVRYVDYLDSAFANAQGMFNASRNLGRNIPLQPSEILQKRLEILTELERYPFSSYAVPAIRSRAQTHISRFTAGLGGTKDDLYKALADYYLLLCSEDIDVLRQQVCQNNSNDHRHYFFSSLDGWRWLDDIIFDRAILLIILGRFEESRKMLDVLENWPEVVDSSTERKLPRGKKPYYASLRSVTGEKIVSHRRSYREQIFIHQIVPGLLVPMNRYYAIRDVVGQIEQAMPEIEERYKDKPVIYQYLYGANNKDTDVGNVIKNEARSPEAYFAYLDFVAERLSLSRLVRNDNVIVVGSFRSRSRAEEQKKIYVSKLGDKLKTIRLPSTKNELGLKVEPLDSGWNRVRVNKDLADNELAPVLSMFNEEGIQTFVSRPTVP